MSLSKKGRLGDHSLLKRLISKGDEVSILNGYLTISPASNKAVPTEWLEKNRDELLQDIAKLLGINLSVFDGYSTGFYTKHKAGGVAVHFINILTGEVQYVVYNAELTRSRTTAKHKKGSPLPDGRFRVGKRFTFYKFWLSTGLKMPSRLSAFHDYMGNLGRLIFCPCSTRGNKITEKIVPLANIGFAVIADRLGVELTNSIHTRTRQQPHKKHTNLPNKDFIPSHVNKGLEAYLSTCETKYDNKFKGSTIIRTDSPVVSVKPKPEEQTNDEWMQCYDTSKEL